MSGAEQVSGSISLDLSGLADTLSRSHGQVLTQINENLARLADLVRPPMLSEEATAAVLAYYLPDYGPADDLAAERQARGLAEAGYALVAVGEPAQQAEAARAGITPVADPRAAQQAREDEWFAPERRV